MKDCFISAGVFVFFCLCGAVVFSASGAEWGTKEAGALVFMIIGVALCAVGVYLDEGWKR